MNNGMIRAFVCASLLATAFAVHAAGEIYKIVDKDGNVTYTDQRPTDAAEPVDLPPLSVIATDVAPSEPAAQTAETEQQAKPPTTRELRRLYADFRITQPQQEETFWGTANTVVVAWGGSQPIPPDLSVRLVIDGESRDVTGNSSLSLSLDRGEHQVYAELRDGRNRPIVTTATITFFVKQASVGYNQGAAGPLSAGH